MKLSKKSIFYRSVSSLSSVIFFIVLFAAASGSVTGVAVAVIVFVMSVSGSLFYQYLYWKNYIFYFEGDDLKIKSGVITKNELDIPSRRIQNVSIEKNFFQRILSIAEIRIETAGGSVSTASLKYIDIEEAEHIKQEIRSLKNRRKASEDEKRQVQEEYRLGLKNLFLLSFTSVSSTVIGLIFAGFFIAGGTIITFTETVISGLGLYLGSIFLLITVGVPLILLNAIVVFIRYYSFTVIREDDTLEYEMGLIKRRGGSIPEEKIQNIIVKENILKRILGYTSLKVETAGYDSQVEGGSKVVVPIEKRGKALSYAEELGGFDFPQMERVTERSRKRYFRRYILLSIIVFLGFTPLVITGRTPSGILILPVVILIFSRTAARLKWQNIGYNIGENNIFTMKGFWLRTMYAVPYFRTQNLVISRSIFQRRWGLSSLTIDTAGSILTNPKIIDMEEEKAEKLRTEVYTKFDKLLKMERL